MDKAGRHADAEPLLTECLAGRRALAKPTTVHNHNDHSTNDDTREALTALAGCLAHLRRFEAALPLLEEALEWQRRAVAQRDERTDPGVLAQGQGLDPGHAAQRLDNPGLVAQEQGLEPMVSGPGLAPDLGAAEVTVTTGRVDDTNETTSTIAAAEGNNDNNAVVADPMVQQPTVQQSVEEGVDNDDKDPQMQQPVEESGSVNDDKETQIQQSVEERVSGDDDKDSQIQQPTAQQAMEKGIPAATDIDKAAPPSSSSPPPSSSSSPPSSSPPLSLPLPPPSSSSSSSSSSAPPSDKDMGVLRENLLQTMHNLAAVNSHLGRIEVGHVLPPYAPFFFIHPYYTPFYTLITPSHTPFHILLLHSLHTPAYTPFICPAFRTSLIYPPSHMPSVSHTLSPSLPPPLPPLQIAAPLYEECFAGRKLHYGMYHKETLTTANNLAVVYDKLKEPRKALDKYLLILEGKRLALAKGGVEHATVVTAAQLVAIRFANLGECCVYLYPFACLPLHSCSSPLLHTFSSLILHTSSSLILHTSSSHLQATICRPNLFSRKWWLLGR